MGHTSSEDGLAYGDSHKETQRKAHEKDMRKLHDSMQSINEGPDDDSRRRYIRDPRDQRDPRDFDPRRPDMRPPRSRPSRDHYSDDEGPRPVSRMTAYRDDRSRGMSRGPPSDYPEIGRGDSRSRSRVPESFISRGRSRHRSPSPLSEIGPRGRTRSRSRMSGYRGSSRSPSWSPRRGGPPDFRDGPISRSPSRISSFHPDDWFPGPPRSRSQSRMAGYRARSPQSRSNIPDFEGRSRTASRGPPPMYDRGYFSDDSRSRSPLRIRDRPEWPESRAGSRSRSHVPDLRRARSMSRAPTAPSVRFSPSPPPSNRRRPPPSDRYAPSPRHGPSDDPRYPPPPPSRARRSSWSRSPPPSLHRRSPSPRNRRSPSPLSRRPPSPRSRRSPSPINHRPPLPDSTRSSHYRPRPSRSVGGSAPGCRIPRSGSIDSIEDSYMSGPAPSSPQRRDYVGERRHEAVNLRRADSPPYPRRPESRGPPPFAKPSKVFYDDKPTRPPLDFLRERPVKHDQQLVIHSPRERAQSEYRRTSSHRSYSSDEDRRAHSPARTPRAPHHEHHYPSPGIMQQVSRLSRHEHHSSRHGSPSPEPEQRMHTVTRNEVLKAGRTKIPFKFVEESVILEQGYDYHVEGRAFIIDNALEQQQIDDLLAQTKVERKRRESGGGFDNTTFIKKKNGHIIERKDRESFHEEIILRPTPLPKHRPISMPPPARHKAPSPPTPQALPAPPPAPIHIPYPVPVPVPVPMNPDARIVTAVPPESYPRLAENIYTTITQGISTGPPPPVPSQAPPLASYYAPPPPAVHMPPPPSIGTVKTAKPWKYTPGPNIKTVAPPSEATPTLKSVAPPYVIPSAPTAPVSSSASLSAANVAALSAAALSTAALSSVGSTFRHRSRSRNRSRSLYRSKSKHGSSRHVSRHGSRHGSSRARSRARSRSVGAALVRVETGSNGSVIMHEDMMEKMDEGRRGTRIEMDRKGQLRISRPKRK